MLHVEYDEAMYNYICYSPARSVRPRTKAFEDFYNVGDELGRGTQGITYHVVERDSGKAHRYVGQLVNNYRALNGS